MSYQFSGSALDGVITEWTAAPQEGYGSEQSLSDIDVARSVAETVASSIGGSVNIQGGGHSNPDRIPEGNWATDYMSINVTCKSINSLDKTEVVIHGST